MSKEYEREKKERQRKDRDRRKGSKKTKKSEKNKISLNLANIYEKPKVLKRQCFLQTVSSRASVDSGNIFLGRNRLKKRYSLCTLINRVQAVYCRDAVYIIKMER